MGQTRMFLPERKEKNYLNTEPKEEEVEKVPEEQEEDHCGFCEFTGSTEDVDEHIATEHPAPELDEEPETEDDEGEEEEPMKSLDEMTYRELQDFAKELETEKDIEIDRSSKKADLLEEILENLE